MGKCTFDGLLRVEVMLHQDHGLRQDVRLLGQLQDLGFILQHHLRWREVWMRLQHHLQALALAPSDIYQFDSARFVGLELAEIVETYDWYGVFDPGKADLEGLEAVGILGHDLPHGRALLAVSPSVWTVGNAVGLGYSSGCVHIIFKVDHALEIFVKAL